MDHPQNQAGARPDIVLLVCDQMQQQRLGTVDPQARTPNLDRIAAEGTDFRRAYCSNAQCSPSRASLQTGLYPHEAGVMVIYGFGGHTGHLGPRHTTIAQVLKEAGYTTAIFGKTHFGYPAEQLGYEHGFERGGGPSLAEVDRRITDDAVGFIRERPSGEPLFLVVSWHQPHPPFETVEPFAADFTADALALPDSFAQDDLAGKPAFQAARRASPGGGYEEARLRHELGQYQSMVSAVDHEVGRVRAALEEAGRWENSVCAFTSDHGDMMGAHGLRLKGPLPYEELFRVPLLLRAPQLPAGRTSEELTVNVELPGTLMELAGVQLPEGWPQRRIAGISSDGPGRRYAFMEHYGAYWGWHPFRMVVSREHKYVRYYGPDEGEEELYDLARDPGECVNLAQDPRYRQVRAELRGVLEEWWSVTGGRDWDHYESEEFRSIDADSLVADNHLWADT